MSCDIVLFGEKRVENVWVHAQDDDLQIEKDFLGYERKIIPEDKSLYPGQSYEFFAILAGVRNYFDIQPIVLPRGLPLDVSNFVEEEEDSFDYAHSHSHLTLRELKDFNWKEHSFTIRAVVSNNQAVNFRERGVIPTCYSRGVQYTLVPVGFEYLEWRMTYEEKASYFIQNILPKLEQFGSPDDVRIVFWFYG